VKDWFWFKLTATVAIGLMCVIGAVYITALVMKWVWG
jgi:hypothetical protein